VALFQMTFRRSFAAGPSFVGKARNPKAIPGASQVTPIRPPLWPN
jgi:hypothetical protein